jgi:halimadienyl-diphosphate synthase
MDYIEEAKELVRNLDQRMGPSPYDIAWMARLRTEDGGPRWPDLINWLLENQHPDGSWGGRIEYYHDRIISTLATIIALRKNGQTQRAKEAIKAGEHYLWHHLHLLPRDPFELAGFELILPTLLVEAQMLGLDVPTHTCGYGEIQTAKLRLIPPEMLYSPHISTVYSLEFLGSSGDLDKMQQAQAPNGSIGNSPSTTAYYLSFHQDEKAKAYLQSVRSHMEYVITVYPFRIFELAWVLNNLILSGVPVTEFAGETVYEELQAEISDKGVGFDSTFTVTDGDTTSICYRVLQSAGYEVDPKGLSYFENEDTRIFRTWDYERNISVSTNVHVLDALSVMPHYPDRQKVQEQIVLMLLNNRTYNMYWTDKWHASPYYATAHALIALLREGDYLAHACRHTVNWLLHTQREDGSWGFFGKGTAEETAYVLTALLHYNRYENIDPDTLHRGADYLINAYSNADSTFPPLWIAKCLYAPYEVIRSAILAAIILYSDFFGC